MNIQALMRDKNYLFWVFQLVGFTGYGITWYLSRVFLNDGSVVDYYALYVLIKTCIGIGITLYLRRLYHWMWDMPIWIRVIGMVVGSYIAAMVWMACRSAIYDGLFEGGRNFPTLTDFLFLVTYSAWWIMAAWSGLYVLAKYYLLFQEERQQSLKIAAMAQETQLKMLRYQLNPHFLFNTLNAISTLILDRDNELAGTMVTRLSRFLRYSLDNDPIQKVSLAQEIEALKLYLDIEKVRFDERLQVEFDIDDKAREALIPSLLLQPLVENSIKYAIAQSHEGGTIKITAQVFARDLLLEVIDDGPGMKPQVLPGKGTGVGLSNTANRLRELYGDNQSFEMCEVDNGGFKVLIRLPLEKPDRPAIDS